MDRHPSTLGAPSRTAEAAKAVRPAAPKRNFASRLFGYDIFLSFALGPPPRGTHSYASDLARRLRERDFSVFFSEDEAPPGEQLDSALRSALLRSKTLVVIANRGTLQDPRWVRTEVEEFRKRHPNRPVIPINVGGALQDPALATSAQEWLGYEGKIWLDEAEEVVATGVASEPVVERLVTAPARVKSNVWWRWVVRGVVVALVALSVALWVERNNAIENAHKATESADRARAELRRAVSLRLVAETPAMLPAADKPTRERAILQALAAHRLAPGSAADGLLLDVLHEWKGVLEKSAVGNVAGAMLRSVRQPIGAQLKVSEGYVLSVAFSPDGKRIVSASDDGTLRLWDANTGLPVGPPFKAYEVAVHSVAFSPDSARIVTGDHGGNLRLWDAKAGQPIGVPLRRHMRGVNSVAFSPDGTRIVSASDDGALCLWNARTGQPIGARLKGHEGSVLSVAFSPDGTRIVSGGYDETLRMWDAKTGQSIDVPFKEPVGHVSSVAFSLDGTRIVSGTYGGTLQLWDAKTGKAIGVPLHRHACGAETVAISPDGTVIASAGGDGGINLCLWDTKTGQPIGAPLQGHSGVITSVAYSPDSTHIVSSSQDQTLRLWPAPKAWPDELCKKLTRNMSRKQWREWVSPEIDYVVQCPGLPIPPEQLE